jgi:Zn-dependent protease with chaperone function
MTTALPEDQRLINLSSKAYEHPADRAATAALQSIPMLDVVVRKLIEFGYERAFRQQFLAASVRLGDDQLPNVWADWNAVCARLDLPERYDVYLTQFPITNAAAIGAGKPMVVINSRCVDLFDELEFRTVLGHEAGHILSNHVLYRTALLILIQLTGATRLPFFAGLPLLAVKLALLEWYRAAELSSDRAATLVNRDPLVTCRTMMVLAGGVSARKLDLDAFIRQANDYEEWKSGWDKLNRLRAQLSLTHSYPVRRVKEVTEWVRSGEYDRIVKGEYPTRDQQADARKEAGEAVEFYKDRFRKIFDEFGGTERVQEKAADAAGKLSDWLRPKNGGDEEK